MTRLIDRMLSRYGDTFWEGEASGAAVLLSSYGSPNKEKILPGLAGHAVNANAANTVVFSAMVARIVVFGEATFTLQSVSDSRTFTDGRLDLLQHPWDDASEGELLARMEQDAGLAGNAYVWAPPGEDLLVRWRPDWVTIISEMVSVQGGWYRKKIGFHFEAPQAEQQEYGPPVTVPASEVAHWAPLPDPQANFRGMSWLTPVIREIDADSGMTGYKLQYLNNAASPNLLVRYSQKLQPGTIDSLRERITARYGGQSNAFRTLVLDQGADATVIGNNLQQMDFSAVQQAGADRILAAAGVPGILVGLESLQGAGRSYGDVMRRFGDLTMRPDWRSACSALQKLVPGLPPRGVRLWFDTSGIAALQEGEQARAQQMLINSQALLTLHNAGYTQESAVAAVTSGDLSQLERDPDAPAAGAQPQPTQHMLPQPPGSGPGVPPLPEGSVPRLNAGTVSPGDGGNSTRPGARPASVRRLEGTPKPGMISLDIDGETGQKLPGDATGHHVTIAHLGDDVSHKTIQRACQAAEKIAARHGPIRATLRGVDEFPRGDSGVPVFAGVDSPEVHALHDQLQHLESPDSKSRQFGYRPHVTLKYNPEPGMPLPSMPPRPVTFTGLHVHHGDMAKDEDATDNYYPFRAAEFGAPPESQPLAMISRG